MKLTVNLQEGFNHDNVIIFADNEKLYERNDVSTRMQIGLAEMIEAEVSEKKLVLKIELRSRGIDSNVEFDPVEKAYVGISITREGQVDWVLSNSPFMYL